MVGIQSATAEIRRGKKKDRKKDGNLGKNIMSASAMQGGHNYWNLSRIGKDSCCESYTLLPTGK